MHSSSKKGALPFEVIIGLVLGLVFLVVTFSIYGAVQTGVLNVETMAQTGCWLTNTIKCGGGLFKGIPSVCSPLEDAGEIETEELASLLRNTWWMYKEGSCNYGVPGNDVYPAYAFIPKEEIDINELLSYLLTHNRGTEIDIEDVKNSDYNYLEENTEGKTLCFDRADSAILNEKLAKGKIYYLLYYDYEQLGAGQGDRILITSDASFTASWAEQVLSQTTPAQSAPEQSPSALGALLGISIISEYKGAEGCLEYGIVEQ